MALLRRKHLISLKGNVLMAMIAHYDLPVKGLDSSIFAFFIFLTHFAVTVTKNQIINFAQKYAFHFKAKTNCKKTYENATF